MPLYEFQCNKCGFKFEDILTFGEHEQFRQGKPYNCPNCGEDEVKQIPSKPSFNTHGRGFEKTGRT